MKPCWTALALLLALAACAPDGTRGESGGKTFVPAARAECEAAGGTVRPGGRMPDELCFRPTPDAGKSCGKAADCTAVCMADSRTCSTITPQFGCYDFLDATGQVQAICVD